jgi:glucan phosphoethanolaminetransferase (alkaline phosphatase superfamily)
MIGNGIELMIGEAGFSGQWQALVAGLFALLLVIGPKRIGLLTNAWVISGVILALAQEFELFNMGVAWQLGGPMKAVIGIAALAVLAMALAVFAGPILRAWSVQIGAVSIAAGLSLLGVAEMQASRGPDTVHAASGMLSTSTRPNVVLIVMDTVRADHLSVYGYERDTTPNLRALGHDSVAYTNAISASDITLTSHASLFTGMYPSWHSAYCQPPEAAYGRKLSDKYPTVAELMKNGGYETVGVAANLYLRSDFGL